MHSTLRFSAGKTTGDVKAIITSQLKNNGGLLTNSSVFRADVDSLSVDVSATRGSSRTSTSGTPASTHRPVYFTITHVRDKDEEWGDESTGSTTETTGVNSGARISNATTLSTLFHDVTRSSVVGEDAGTQGSVRFSLVSSDAQAPMTTMLEHERTTRLVSEREHTVRTFSVLEGKETQSQEDEATTQIVLSTGRTTLQQSRHDETTQLVLPGEKTTRSSIMFTTDQSSDPLHTSTETLTESLPLTITTASEPEQYSTSATSVDTVSAEIYPTEYSPITESPSVEIVVTDSVTVKDMSRTTPVWRAITDSLIRIAETTSHPVQNAVSESTIVDNPFTGSHIADNPITESHRVDNPFTKSPRVDNAVTESHHVDNDITDNHVVDNTVTENHYVDNPITESHHVDTPITETHHVDNAVTESPSSAIDATESIATERPPTTTHSLISTHWQRIMIILNRTKDTPTASLTSKMTLSTADNASNFRTSTASEIEGGVNTTKQTYERTPPALQSKNFSPTTKMDDIDSTNGGPFTAVTESQTFTGTTHSKIKSSNSDASKINF